MTIKSLFWVCSKNHAIIFIEAPFWRLASRLSDALALPPFEDAPAPFVEPDPNDFWIARDLA